MTHYDLHKLEEIIRKNASEKLFEEENEDWCPVDSGNYDDAYEAGTYDGYTMFARDLLKIIEGK